MAQKDPCTCFAGRHDPVHQKGCPLYVPSSVLDDAIRAESSEWGMGKIFADRDALPSVSEMAEDRMKHFRTAGHR